MDTDSARELVQQLPERVREWRPEHLRAALPERAVNLLPDAAQERLGRKRRRPRWLVLGVIAGLAVAGVWLALKVKRALAPGYDEDEDDEPLGEPLDYPATGSGTGWPDGARSRENTEVLGERSAATAAPAASASPPAPPPAPPSAPPPAPPAPPPVVTSPHLASGGATPAGETGRLAADTAAPAERTGFERPRDLDATLAFPAPHAAEPERPPSPDPKQALAGTVWAESRDVAPAQRSEPAQRPPVPFTESQAETNAWLQLQQDALFEAFPGVTRGDLVECDGDLDRLAVIISTRLNRPIDEVRGRIDAILSTGEPQQKADTGIGPDLNVREG